MKAPRYGMGGQPLAAAPLWISGSQIRRIWREHTSNTGIQFPGRFNPSFPPMPTSYHTLARQHLRELYTLLRVELEDVYASSLALAETEFESNQAFHCGYARWGKANDALFRAGVAVGAEVARVPCGNGQVHTECVEGPFTLVVAKGDEPGFVQPAGFRTELAKMTTGWLFENDPAAAPPERPIHNEDEEPKIFAVIQHIPAKDNIGELGELWLIVPGEEGAPPLASIRLDTLFAEEPEVVVGVEVIPDEAQAARRRNAEEGR